MLYFWIFTIFLFGAAIGSFLNVCIVRIPKGESLIHPGSYCPRCGTKILPRDNIPILSYLLLLGRCRSCRSRIGLQYPLVEILTPLLLTSLFLFYRGQSVPILLLNFFFFGIFISLLIIVFFIDMKHQIIPDKITYPGILLGILFSLLRSPNFLASSLLGIFGGGVFLYLVMKLGGWIYKKEVMGGGDVKLASLLGAFLGGTGVAISLFLAFLLGSLVGGGFIISGRLQRTSLIPFGPFIVAGGLLTLFFQEELILLYNRLVFRF